MIYLLLGKGDAIFEGEVYEDNMYTALTAKIVSISQASGSTEVRVTLL